MPELSALPAETVHSPWTASAEALQEASIALGASYPFPIVDHQDARARALSSVDILNTQNQMK
ncbi:hypothetical protein BC2230_120215 [Burkholderia cepacia]